MVILFTEDRKQYIKMFLEIIILQKERTHGH